MSWKIVFIIICNPEFFRFFSLVVLGRSLNLLPNLVLVASRNQLNERDENFKEFHFVMARIVC